MKHMIAILTWLGLSAGMLHAHYFDVAIVVPPGDGQACRDVVARTQVVLVIGCSTSDLDT